MRLDTTYWYDIVISQEAQSSFLLAYGQRWHSYNFDTLPVPTANLPVITNQRVAVFTYEYNEIL